jgi:hypothetical protein
MELLFVVWMSEARGRAEVTAGVTSKELDVTADGVWVGWGFTVEWMEFRLCPSSRTGYVYTPAESK